MKIKPTEFEKDTNTEAEISDECFDGGEYKVWFEFPRPEEKEGDGKKKKVNAETEDGEEIDYRDYEIHVEVGTVYSRRMDVNVDVEKTAPVGYRDLHVKNINGEDKFVLKKAAEVVE